MSWFNLDSLNTTLTESLTQVSTSLNQVKTQVQSTLQIDDDLVEALTLRTASLTAERDAIDAEESRKETVKNYLAEMLPWETRDEEREILVEECKEVMLKLSCAEDTFEGPFASSPPNNEVNEEEGEEMEGKLTEVRSSSTPPHLDKLAKLEPLPPLLEEFDLDTHVGLIQRLLGVDENLSRVHSQLSSTCLFILLRHFFKILMPFTILVYSHSFFFSFQKQSIYIRTSSISSKKRCG